jgi:hypothetical protein
MSTATVSRVHSSRSHSVNRQIAGRVVERLSRCATSNALAARQLSNLQREWDLERALQTWFASVVLTGVTLAATRHRRWMALPAVAAGFMLQHAVQGWCPPLPVFRRLGVRTAHEIEEERYALKALRGDFRDVAVGDGHDPARTVRALQAVRR